MVELMKYHLLCTLALSLIFGIFAFLSQLEEVEGASYQTLDAIWYVAMTTPERFVEFAPFVALFGTLFALADLTRHSEIISVLSFGHSFGYIVARTLVASLPLIAITMATAQWFAPILHKKAELRKIAQSSGFETLVRGQGFWVRQDDNILNVRAFGSGTMPKDITLYELDQDGKLRSQLKAESALLTSNGNWRFQEVQQRHLHSDKTEHIYSQEQFWIPFMQDIQANLYELPLASFSPRQLLEKQALLVQQGLSGYQLGFLFWQRILLPFTIIGMICLVAAFILTNPQRGHLGGQALICAGLGIFCALLTQGVVATAQTWGLHAIFIGILPGSLLLVLAFIRYYRSDIIV